MRDFDRSIEIDGKNAEVFAARAEHKDARLKDSTEALSDYDKALALSPANAAIFIGCAGVRAATSDIQGTIDDYSSLKNGTGNIHRLFQGALQDLYGVNWSLGTWLSS